MRVKRWTAGSATSERRSGRCSTATGSSRITRRLRCQVDDHVRHRDVEAEPRLLDDPLLEPVRAARWMRRDDDLVGGEHPERVLERLQRVAVADLAARRDPGLAEPREARVETRLCRGPRAVLVRRPRVELRVQCRAHDEDVLADPFRLSPEELVELAARNRLVRHDEDLPRRPAVVDHVRLRGPLAHAAADRKERDDDEREEDDDSEPGVDPGAQCDENRAAERQEHDPEGRRLVAQRVLHSTFLAHAPRCRESAARGCRPRSTR